MNWLITRWGWLPPTLSAVVVAAGHEAGTAATMGEVAVLVTIWVAVWLWLGILIMDGARLARGGKAMTVKHARHEEPTS